MDSLGQNTGVGSLSLLQGIFPTLGSKMPPRDERSVGLGARVQGSEVRAGGWLCVCRALGFASLLRGACAGLRVRAYRVRTQVSLIAGGFFTS